MLLVLRGASPIRLAAWPPPAWAMPPPPATPMLCSDWLAVHLGGGDEQVHGSIEWLMAQLADEAPACGRPPAAMQEDTPTNTASVCNACPREMQGTWNPGGGGVQRHARRGDIWGMRLQSGA